MSARGLLDWRRRLGGLGLSGAVLLLALGIFLRAAGTQLREGLIFPDEHPWEELSSFWVYATFALGLVFFGWERLTGAREFLLHRSVSRSRLATERTLSGLAAVALLIGALQLLPGPLRAVFDPNGAKLSWPLVGRTALLATACLATFSAGAFTATVRAALPQRVVLGTVALACVVWSAKLLVAPDPLVWARPWWPYLGVQLGWTVVFLAAAHGSYLEDDDVDRPAEPARLVREGLPAALIFVVLGLLFVPVVQDSVQKKNFSRSPDIVRRPDGAIGLVQRGRNGAPDVLLDAELRPLLGDRSPDEPEPDGAGEVLFSPGKHVRSLQAPVWDRLQPQRTHFGRDPRIGACWEAAGHDFPWLRCFLVRPEGRLHTVRLVPFAEAQRATWRRVVGRGASGEPFSESVELLGYVGPFGVEAERILIGDPEDATLWSYAYGDPEAVPERVPLPGDDAYVGWSFLAAFPGGRPGRIEAPEGVIVHGERGDWVWGEDGWVPCTEPAPEEPPVEVVHDDPLAWTVTVTGAEGASFVHRYVPRTGAERARSLLAQAFLLWRPPLVVLASFATPDPPVSDPGADSFRWARFSDPLVRGGDRAWLVLLHLAIVVSVIASVVRRLRRNGADRGRTVFWAVAIALGGPPVWYAYICLEPDGAWLPLPEPERAPEPLIRTQAGGVS